MTANELLDGQLSSDAVPVPVIVGIGRSGSTLLRLMLDAHPELAIPPETHFIPAVAEACQTSSDPREAFLREITSAYTWADFHIAIDLLKSRITAIEPFNFTLALRAFFRLYAEKFGKQRWGDKSNSYLWSMIRIQELIPEARFIHLVRDGRDYALSVKDLWWGPNSVEEGAVAWSSAIQLARRHAPRLRYYMEIRYEDLVRDAECHLRKICDFIELAWNPAMLEYYKTAEERLLELTTVIFPIGQKEILAEKRRGIHTRVKQPLDACRVGKWKTEMSAAQKTGFDSIAGPLLREFGYDRD